MDMKTAPLSLLNDPTLLKTDSLINGQWVAGTSRFDVNDPVTGKKLADVANLGPADAIAKGGKVVVGGKKLNGQFFEPTVISGATADMLCAKEETFGPFAPVFRFHKDQEAIDAANNTEFGLASYFYSPRCRSHLSRQRGFGVRYGGHQRWRHCNRTCAVWWCQTIRIRT